MTSAGRTQSKARDQEVTGFTGLLEALVQSLPEAICAVFVDPEGETVDLASRIDPFDARVTGAEFTIVLATVRAGTNRGGIGQALELRVECGSKSVLVRMVSEGYDLVVLLQSPTISVRAAEKTQQCAMALLREAGLPPPPSFAKLKSGEVGRSSPPGRGSLRQSNSQSIPSEPMMVQDKSGAKIVSEVVGISSDSVDRRLLVRLEDGEEALIAYDAGSNRWKRAT